MSDLDRRSALKAGIAGLAAVAGSAALSPPAPAAGAPAAPPPAGATMPLPSFASPLWLAQAAPMALRTFANAQAVANSGRWKFERSVANAPQWVTGAGAPKSLADLLGLYPGPIV